MKAKYHSEERQFSKNVNDAMKRMEEEAYLAKFESPTQLDGNELLANLQKVFAEYEVPIGLLSKLPALADYRLYFIVDDSGSMTSKSDVLCAKACEFMGDLCENRGHMSRWQEVQNRLHGMFRVLPLVPTLEISIAFLNRKDSYVLNRKGNTPEQFEQEAHALINKLFEQQPTGSTPIYEKLKSALAARKGKTKYFLFTDGEPDGGPDAIWSISDLLCRRPSPQDCPFTFISCTNESAEWMKIVEGKAPYVAELDDDKTEEQEIVKKQGKVFSKYVKIRGLLAVGTLVSDINPEDLDALDEPQPFTKKTLNELSGYINSDKSYEDYFTHHPSYRKYRYLSEQFKREDVRASEILAFPLALKTLAIASKVKAEKTSKHHDNMPVLARCGKEIYIYGLVNDQWMLTKLAGEAYIAAALLKFPKLRKKSQVLNADWIKHKELYCAIAEIKGHRHTPVAVVEPEPKLEETSGEAPPRYEPVEIKRDDFALLQLPKDNIPYTYANNPMGMWPGSPIGQSLVNYSVQEEVDQNRPPF